MAPIAKEKYAPVLSKLTSAVTVCEKQELHSNSKCLTGQTPSSLTASKKKKVLLFKAEQLRIIISWKATGCRHGRPLKFQRGDLEVPDNNI